MATSTWGDPTATKRAFLLHGLTSSSRAWYHIAQVFVSRGYFVVAPDLLGHGLARRSSTYTIAALVDDLRPHFIVQKGGRDGDDRPYHVVVGHSLGGVLTAALLPLLASAQPISVVLVDPPLDIIAKDHAMTRVAIVDRVRNPKTPEELIEMNPAWTKEYAAMVSENARLCDVAAVEGILDQNMPWSFMHYLTTIPDNVRVTVLAADPSMGACVREEQLKAYPSVPVRTLWGASHSILNERPEIVVETALEGEDRN